MNTYVLEAFTPEASLVLDLLDAPPCDPIFEEDVGGAVGGQDAPPGAHLSPSRGGSHSPHPSRHASPARRSPSRRSPTRGARGASPPRRGGGGGGGGAGAPATPAQPQPPPRADGEAHAATRGGGGAAALFGVGAGSGGARKSQSERIQPASSSARVSSSTSERLAHDVGRRALSSRLAREYHGVGALGGIALGREDALTDGAHQPTAASAEAEAEAAAEAAAASAGAARSAASALSRVLWRLAAASAPSAMLAAACVYSTRGGGGGDRAPFSSSGDAACVATLSASCAILAAASGHAAASRLAPPPRPTPRPTLTVACCAALLALCSASSPLVLLRFASAAAPPPPAPLPPLFLVHVVLLSLPWATARLPARTALLPELFRVALFVAACSSAHPAGRAASLFSVAVAALQAACAACVCLALAAVSSPLPDDADARVAATFLVDVAGAPPLRRAQEEGGGGCTDGEPRTPSFGSSKTPQSLSPDRFAAGGTATQPPQQQQQQPQRRSSPRMAMPASPTPSDRSPPPPQGAPAIPPHRGPLLTALLRRCLHALFSVRSPAAPLLPRLSRAVVARFPSSPHLLSPAPLSLLPLLAACCSAALLACGCTPLQAASGAALAVAAALAAAAHASSSPASRRSGVASVALSRASSALFVGGPPTPPALGLPFPHAASSKQGAGLLPHHSAVFAALSDRLACAGSEEAILKACASAALALLPSALGCAIGVFSAGAGAEVVASMEVIGGERARGALRSALPPFVGTQWDASVAKACAAAPPPGAPSSGAAPQTPGGGGGGAGNNAGGSVSGGAAFGPFATPVDALVDSRDEADGMASCCDWAAAAALGDATSALTAPLTCAHGTVGFLSAHFGVLSAREPRRAEAAAVSRLCGIASSALFTHRALALSSFGRPGSLALGGPLYSYPSLGVGGGPLSVGPGSGAMSSLGGGALPGATPLPAPAMSQLSPGSTRRFSTDSRFVPAALEQHFGAHAGAGASTPFPSTDADARALDALDASAAADGARLRDPCFELREECGDDELVRLVLAMSHSLGLLRACRVSPAALASFAGDVASRCNALPFHTWRNAVATAHAVWRLLGGAEPLDGAAAWRRSTLNDGACLALLLAGLCVHIEHPGVGDAFLVATSAPLALRYNDSAVLRSHAAAVAGASLERSRLLAPAQRPVRAALAAALVGSGPEAVPQLLAAAKAAAGAPGGVAAATFPALAAPPARLLLPLLLAAADVAWTLQPHATARRLAAAWAEEGDAQASMEEAAGLPRSQPAHGAPLPAVELSRLDDTVAPLFALLGSAAPHVAAWATPRIRDAKVYWQTQEHAD